MVLAALFRLEVIVDGRALREYPYAGEQFVEGSRGSEFTLRVTNTGSRRALAVVSVDGLSVMDGKRASRVSNGYIVNARGSLEIPGWRLTNNDVAHFAFATRPEAYATQMDQPENVGVIGVAFVLERVPVALAAYEDLEPMRGSNTFGTKSATRDGGLGTGYGRRTEHRVTSVNFDRDPSTMEELRLRYDDRDGLMARGIFVDDPVLKANPFPADSTPRYTTPPPGWQG